MSSLARRARTGAVLLAAVAGGLALRETGLAGWPWVLFVAAACALAIWEWSGLLGLGRELRPAYLAACVFLAWTLAFLSPMLFTIVFWTTVGFWVLALLRVVGVPFPPATEMPFFGMLGLGAVPVAGLILINFSGIFLWMLLAVVMVADTAAYGFGRRWGRAALAPDISPGKTRAGFVGALLSVAAAALLMAWGLGFPPPTWFYFVCLALLAACFSVVGDLAVSLLKRRAGVKDSGRLLPGHGGVLDRVDGLLAAAPVFVLGVQALQGVVPL